MYTSAQEHHKYATCVVHPITRKKENTREEKKVLCIKREELERLHCKINSGLNEVYTSYVSDLLHNIYKVGLSQSMSFQCYSLENNM